MNLVISGLSAELTSGDTLRKYRHQDLNAEQAHVGPPFDKSDWRGDLQQQDERSASGASPSGKDCYRTRQTVGSAR